MMFHSLGQDRIRPKKKKKTYFASSDPHHGIQSSHLTFCLANLLTFYLAYLSGILSDIYSDMLSGISSDILSGISSDFYLAFYLAFSLAFYMALFLAVEVRLRSGEAYGTQNLAGSDLAWPTALGLTG